MTVIDLDKERLHLEVEALAEDLRELQSRWRESAENCGCEPAPRSEIYAEIQDDKGVPDDGFACWQKNLARFIFAKQHCYICHCFIERETARSHSIQCLRHFKLPPFRDRWPV